MSLFPLTPKDLQRLRQIANVFIKHGFGYLVESLNLQRYLSLGKKIITFKKGAEGLKKGKHSIAERGRIVLEELGPTFVKLGQILSARRSEERRVGKEGRSRWSPYH